MEQEHANPPDSADRARNGRGARNNISTIHDLLRDEILNGKRAAGSVLSQVQLADSFGVSRGPVREALRLLEREGLVDAELNRRVRVAAFSIEDLEEVYAMRIINETLAVSSTVPQLKTAEIEALRGDLEEMDAFAGKDVVAWEEPHRRFHSGLVAGAGPRLLRLVEQLSDHAERYRRAYIVADPRAWATGSAEHLRIFEAVERGDAAASSNALTDHLARTALTVIANAAPEHDPALVREAVRGGIGPEKRPPRSKARRSRVA